MSDIEENIFSSTTIWHNISLGTNNQKRSNQPSLVRVTEAFTRTLVFRFCPRTALFMNHCHNSVPTNIMGCFFLQTKPILLTLMTLPFFQVVTMRKGEVSQQRDDEGKAVQYKSSEMWPATRRAQKKTNADVDDGGARCIVPALRGPPTLKFWSQDRSSNPYRVLSS